MSTKEPDSSHGWRGRIFASVKVLLSVGVTVGIAWCIVTFSASPDDESGIGVESGQADILWANADAPSQTEKFERALDQLGHEPPRKYDVNGNEIFFSTRSTPKSPEQVLRRYQHRFVVEQINSEKYLKGKAAYESRTRDESADPERHARLEARFSGEVVPSKVSDRRVTMSGVVLKAGFGENVERRLEKDVEAVQTRVENMERAYQRCGGDPAMVERIAADLKPETESIATASIISSLAIKGEAFCKGRSEQCKEWADKIDRARRQYRAHEKAIERQNLSNCLSLKGLRETGVERKLDRFAERITAFRSIQIDRHPSKPVTLVTATWSERGFDVDKIRPGAEGFPEDAEVQGNFPVCEQCERAWTFGGNGEESDYAHNVVWSDRSVAATTEEYVKIMRRRGWRLQAGREALRELGVSKFVDTGDSHSNWLRWERGERVRAIRIERSREEGRTRVMSFVLK